MQGTKRASKETGFALILVRISTILLNFHLGCDCLALSKTLSTDFDRRCFIAHCTGCRINDGLDCVISVAKRLPDGSPPPFVFAFSDAYSQQLFPRSD